MHTIKLCVASTPMGFDKDISKISENILSAWKNSIQGKWVEEHAKKLYTEFVDVHEELGMRFEIYAEFDEESAIAHKLTFGQ